MKMEEVNGCCENNDKSGDRLMGQKEVAEILCLSVKTLEFWRWKNAGGPKWVKVGRLARYRESDVRMYVEQLGK